MFVDLDQRLLIGLAPSRQYENIQKVLEGWGQAVLNQITEVSIDLSGNYRGLARKQMPKAQSRDRPTPRCTIGESGVEPGFAIKQSNQSTFILMNWNKARNAILLRLNKFRLYRMNGHNADSLLGLHPPHRQTPNRLISPCPAPANTQLAGGVPVHGLVYGHGITVFSCQVFLGMRPRVARLTGLHSRALSVPITLLRWHCYPRLLTASLALSS